MNKTRNGWNLNNNCGCSTVKTSPHVALLRGLTWNQHLCTEHKHLWLDHDDLELYETETGEVLVREKGPKFLWKVRTAMEQHAASGCSGCRVCDPTQEEVDAVVGSVERKIAAAARTVRFIDGPLMGQLVPYEYQSAVVVEIFTEDRTIEVKGGRIKGAHVYNRRGNNFYFSHSTGEPTADSPYFGGMMAVRRIRTTDLPEAVQQGIARRKADGTYDRAIEAAMKEFPPTRSPSTSGSAAPPSRVESGCSDDIKRFAEEFAEKYPATAAVISKPVEWPAFPATLNGLPVVMTERLPKMLQAVNSGNVLAVGHDRSNPILTVRSDGKVNLSPDIDLTQVRTLPLNYLIILREIVNTAIYDLENGK